MVGQDYGEEHPHGLAVKGAMRVPVQWAWFLTSVFQYSGCWILTIKWDVLELNAGVMVTVSKWKILYKANKKVKTFVNWKPEQLLCMVGARNGEYSLSNKSFVSDFQYISFLLFFLSICKQSIKYILHREWKFPTWDLCPTSWISYGVTAFWIDSIK